MTAVFSAFFHVTIILVFSLVTLGIAISYAITPQERKMSLLRLMSMATLFSVLSGMCAGMGMTFFNAASGASGPMGAGTSELILAGLAEATVAAVVGFSILAITWLLAAVGQRRHI